MVIRIKLGINEHTQSKCGDIKIGYCIRNVIKSQNKLKLVIEFFDNNGVLMMVSLFRVQRIEIIRFVSPTIRFI